jgi:hypothetical protein
LTGSAAAKASKEEQMAVDDQPRFRVNGRDYLVPTTFTVGEMCDAERYFGVEFGSDAAGSSMRMAAAMLWIAVRREDPTVTVDDIRNLPPDVFSALGEESRPPETLELNANNGSSGDDSDSVSDLLVVGQSPSGAQG